MYHQAEAKVCVSPKGNATAGVAEGSAGGGSSSPSKIKAWLEKNVFVYFIVRLEVAFAKLSFVFFWWTERSYKKFCEDFWTLNFCSGLLGSACFWRETNKRAEGEYYVL